MDQPYRGACAAWQFKVTHADEGAVWHPTARLSPGLSSDAQSQFPPTPHEGSPSVVTIGAGMRTLLECIRDELDLKSAQIYVDRIGCNEKCRFDTEAAYNVACGVYPAVTSWVDVKELDDLAADMEVELRDGS
ncbi:uncharacterized protein MYCFIDRAFT_200889 [Pseudocercospora fijiensis CIRAD86]|uniref:Uncharacterized protein n=1 Tax=Pseudocercospora fijiensis (strain CIRAD86) TaxID=383855 RepID=M2YGF7_PSEFD|nr:uncharacterized protein MYCFIDRAFT_200889 [Pseudocercospora fijiensis CIRAD86]EME76880.1 hypothetical protein MYCFIDRAFT_200889 [Pseudocercospora fijiensis CIRAD86]